MDAYITANEDMKASMVQMGAPEEKVHPFGIPVGETFFSPGNKTALLREFDLTPNVPTVLFMAGSFGVSNILEIYRKLQEIPEPYQTVSYTHLDVYKRQTGGSH